MNFLIFVLFFMAAKENYAYTPQISEVRILYQEAPVNHTSCATLLSLLGSFNERNNALLAGYKACATMIMSKYIVNPFKKISNFTQGKLLLERSIAADKENIELRLLRFTVQTKAPPFLGYNKTIEADKNILLSSFITLKDIQLKQLIISVLRTSMYLSSAEKQIVNR